MHLQEALDRQGPERHRGVEIDGGSKRDDEEVQVGDDSERGAGDRRGRGMTREHNDGTTTAAAGTGSGTTPPCSIITQRGGGAMHISRSYALTV